MSGPSKSNANQRNSNFWWYMKHGSKKGRKRKKQLGNNKDKSNAEEEVITKDREKEREVKKSITGVGTGAIGTDSISEVILSKQARKRKLKREAAKQEKLEKKKKKLQLNGQGTFGKGTFGKDKEQERTSVEQRRRTKRFKRKRHKRKNDLEGSISHLVVTAGETSLVDEHSSNNKEKSAVLKMPSKGPDENVNKSEKSKKEPWSAKMQIKGDTSRSGDKTHDTNKDVEVDKNWKALMKKINYQPNKNLREEGKKVKLGQMEEGLKGNQEIWFDDVDPELLEDDETTSNSETRKEGNPDLIKGGTPSTSLTKYIGIDCEMVGIGPNGEDHMLARVSLVNQHGSCIYDKFVAPSESITDYRTSVSGITPEKLKNAEDFATVQQEVYDIIKGRILVGHAVQNDLKVLFLSHKRSMIRDTSTYKPFQELCKTKRPSLKKLSRMILDVTVQRSSHDSVEDAQAAMKLFMLHRQAWEKDMKKTHKHREETEASDKMKEISVLHSK